jgi:hypothetical protein
MRSTNSQGSWAQIFVSSASVVFGGIVVGVVGCEVVGVKWLRRCCGCRCVGGDVIVAYWR